MSSFKIGQKVVCLFSDWNVAKGNGYQKNPPKKNDIVTIKDFLNHDKYGLLLNFKECSVVDNGDLDWYQAAYFRPLDHQFAEDVIKNLIETSQPVEV